MLRGQNPVAFEAVRLKELFALVQGAGYRMAGPKIKSEAVAFDFLQSFDEIPQGYCDDQSPGQYRLKKTDRPTYFEYVVGPQSIKNILHPSRRKLWEAKTNPSGGFRVEETKQDLTPIALFGVRACDVKALDTLDGVFLNAGLVDPHYQALRENLFIVAAHCSEPSSLCFCTSMGYGPEAEHFDLNLFELWSSKDHRILALAGSKKGQDILNQLSACPARDSDVTEAERAKVEACRKVTKTLNTVDLHNVIKQNPLHPRWSEIAETCLSCGNCTMVCPTCFCTTTEDISAVTGDHTERWLTWDSCFTADFSAIHGGTVRKSTASRYRQWLTHKLSTWFDQFGSSGCVGCGRCIAWCPVGIDLTKEAEAIRRQP